MAKADVPRVPLLSHGDLPLVRLVYDKAVLAVDVGTDKLPFAGRLEAYSRIGRERTSPIEKEG